MRLICAALLAVLFTACVTLTDSQRAQRWQQHQEQLAQFTHWRMSGRIVVSTDKDGGNARLIWKQRGGDFDLRISAAFGQGILQISGDADGAELLAPSGARSQAASAEYLLQQYLGWRVPLEQLRAWLLGKAGTANYTLRGDGLLATAKQNGWTVEYQKYLRDQIPILPQRLLVYRDDVRIKLAIDTWSQHQQTIESQRLLLPETAAE